MALFVERLLSEYELQQIPVSLFLQWLQLKLEA